MIFDNFVLYYGLHEIQDNKNIFNITSSVLSSKNLVLCHFDNFYMSSCVKVKSI